MGVHLGRLAYGLGNHAIAGDDEELGVDQNAERNTRKKVNRKPERMDENWMNKVN